MTQFLLSKSRRSDYRDTELRFPRHKMKKTPRSSSKQDAAPPTVEALREATVTLTAKRIGAGEDLDRWYPYYAGYSHQFATQVLEELCRDRVCTVLDPWNGSGTTMAAALHEGHQPLGFDLNPATLVVANAKLAHRAAIDRLPRLLDDCLAAAKKNLVGFPTLSEDPLTAWLPPRAAAFSRHSLNWLAIQASGVGGIPFSPTHSLAAICLLRAMRRFAVDLRSNVSWAMPTDDQHRVRVDSLENVAWQVADELLQDRSLLPRNASKARAQLGDARSLPLRARSVDVVLTSPPYCTRIDYAKQTGFELAALLGADDKGARSLRNQLMGTTTLRKPASSSPKQPSSIRSLLKSIRAHRSHRSAEYYYVNIKQYFDDAFLAVGQVARVLRSGGRAALVLQNSYYKELHIPLSDLFCDLGAAHGLAARVLVRKEVTRSMTSVNTRARKYRATRSYTEDVVLMEKKG
jgi:hypothetical protein